MSDDDSRAWGIAFSRMSDTQLSERLQELRDMVKIIGLQLSDVTANIDAINIEQSRRQNQTIDQQNQTTEHLMQRVAGRRAFRGHCHEANGGRHSAGLIGGGVRSLATHARYQGNSRLMSSSGYGCVQIISRHWLQKSDSDTQGLKSV